MRETVQPSSLFLIAGFLVVGGALIVEVKYQPPFWVHAALWIPMVLAVTLLPLRVLKSLLIAQLQRDRD
jgi:uncharacterized protein (DUF983 family)